MNKIAESRCVILSQNIDQREFRINPARKLLAGIGRIEHWLASTQARHQYAA